MEWYVGEYEIVTCREERQQLRGKAHAFTAEHSNRDTAKLILVSLCKTTYRYRGRRGATSSGTTAPTPCSAACVGCVSGGCAAGGRTHGRLRRHARGHSR